MVAENRFLFNTTHSEVGMYYDNHHSKIIRIILIFLLLMIMINIGYNPLSRRFFSDEKRCRVVSLDPQHPWETTRSILMTKGAADTILHSTNSKKTNDIILHKKCEPEKTEGKQ
jgi:hypothetical protein